MDVNVVRIIVTCTSFLAFIGIAVWAFSSRNRARFDEAANIPFMNERDLEVASSQAKVADSSTASNQQSTTDNKGRSNG